MQGTLAGMADPETQRLAQQVARDPEVHRAAREFLSQSVDDGLAVLSDREREARIEQLSTRYITAMSAAVTRAMADGLRRDLSPAVAQMVRTTLATTMRETLNGDYQRDLERVMGGVTRSAVESASQAMAQSMVRDMAPAMQEVMRDPQMRAAIETHAHAIGHHLVLGVNQALVEIRANEQAAPSLITDLGGVTRNGISTARLLAMAATAVSALLFAVVVFLLVRARRARAESERNAADALMLAEAIRAAEGRPWAKELVDLVREKVRHEGDDDPIGDIIERMRTRPRRAPRVPRLELRRPVDQPAH